MEGIKNKTNCPNCGAALPQFGGKCEFCGTRVVDLTMLDFDAREPTMFLLRLPQSINGGRLLISMWAQPELHSITMESDPSIVYGSWGQPVAMVNNEPKVAFEMSLRPCADPRDKSLFKMQELTIE